MRPKTTNPTKLGLHQRIVIVVALEAPAEQADSPLWRHVPVDQDPIRLLLDRRVPWMTHGDTFSSQLMGTGAWRGQGWKLHVSATPRNAVEVLSRSLDVLLAHGVRFKVVSSQRMLAAMNSAMFAKSQVGKFITVYPSDDAQAVRLAVDLDRVTRGQCGPRVPTDRVLRPASLVHYRYGAMRQSESAGETSYDLLDPAGRLTHDVRLGFYQPPSREVVDPFEAAGVREPVAPRSRFLNGRYLVTDALAQSVRGGVFRAVDAWSQPPRVCLVKESWHDVALDPFGRDARDWAANEQAILSGHPDDPVIPRFFDAFEIDGDCYLVIEYIEGLTIERMLIDRDSADASMDISEIVAAGLATADALAHLHDIGLVFRDFKPANVVRTRNGDYRLIDFGIAFEFQSSQARPLSIGTPPFYSPEQYAGSPPCPADDIFSWGAVLHFLIAGPASTTAMGSGDDFLEPFRRRPLGELCTVPDAVAAVVDRAVAWEPGDRYETMQQAKHALAVAARALQRAPTTTGAIEPVTRTEGSTGSSAVAELLSPDGALRRAREVGDALCAEAEEHGGGLRWMRRFEHGEDTEYDPDLYGGAAGIGLFLAELARATGEDRYATAARGAARWLAGSTWGRGRAQHGFHSGEAGVAYFFVRIAELLEAPGYLDGAVIRLRRLRGAPSQTVDVMYGLAGTLIGALAVHAATGEPEFLDDALAAAEHLVSERICVPSGCYWGISAANLGGPIAPYLGFLHGSAGIGFALALLAQATGDERYLDIAAAAADLLLAAARPVAGSPALVWPRQLGEDSHGVQAHCHGAGGIGQFLLFLNRLTCDRRYRDAAMGAASAMASRSTTEARSGVCHGLSGSGHFFLDIYQSEKKSQWLEHARDCAHRLDSFRMPEWPGKYSINQQKAVSPDLMIGYAGVGGFQLRLADPADAPDLVLGRLDFGA